MSLPKKGNVKLRIEMDASDAERLIAAFKAGKLAALGVVSIEFPTQAHPNDQPAKEGHTARHQPQSKKQDPHHR
jgi:hypothetical protein